MHTKNAYICIQNLTIENLTPWKVSILNSYRSFHVWTFGFQEVSSPPMATGVNTLRECFVVLQVGTWRWTDWHQVCHTRSTWRQVTLWALALQSSFASEHHAVSHSTNSLVTSDSYVSIRHVFYWMHRLKHTKSCAFIYKICIIFCKDCFFLFFHHVLCR